MLYMYLVTAMCLLFTVQYYDTYVSVIPFLPAPSAPLNLTFPPGGISNDSITLSWLHPLSPNGVIRFYQGWYVSPVQNAPVFTNTTDNATMVVASSARPGTQYNVSVRAFTVAFGPFSAALIIHTADGEDGCCTICTT